MRTMEWACIYYLACIYASMAADNAEREVLASLYVTMGGGTSWTNTSGWLSTDTPHCSWFGVQCDNGRVNGLSLSTNQLTGSIPRILATLSCLERLSLDLNALSGSIPAQLNALTALRHLNLQANNLVPPNSGTGPFVQGLHPAPLSGNPINLTLRAPYLRAPYCSSCH